MKKTSRGFPIFAEFTDSYHNTIRVQESSNAEKHCCWIFVTDAQGRSAFEHCGELTSPSAHLTKAQAKRLVRALNVFIEAP